MQLASELDLESHRFDIIYSRLTFIVDLEAISALKGT